MQGYDNKPSFTLKPTSEHKKEQKGKWIFVLHQSVGERATATITKTTENQADSRRDKTQHGPRKQRALPCTPGYQTGEGDSKGRNGKANFVKLKRCVQMRVFLFLWDAAFSSHRMEEFSGQEAVENSAADPAQGQHLTSGDRCDFLSVFNTSKANRTTGVVASSPL